VRVVLVRRVMEVDDLRAGRREQGDEVIDRVGLVRTADLLALVAQLRDEGVLTEASGGVLLLDALLRPSVMMMPPNQRSLRS